MIELSLCSVVIMTVVWLALSSLVIYGLTRDFDHGDE